MTWTPPVFTPGVAWENAPSVATPLDATELNLEESAEAAYAASVGTSVAAYFEGGSSPSVVNLSSPVVAGTTGQRVIVRSDGTVKWTSVARVPITAWGAKCDNATTDDTTAWSNAVTALAGTGAIIEVPGNSLVSQITVPDNSVDLSIVSAGSQHNGARTGCITSTYGGSGPVLQAHGAKGFKLQCSVVNTNAAFTGDLVDIQRGAASGDTTMFTVENCQLQAVAQAGSAVTLLRLTKATAGRARGVYFYGGKQPIEGKVIDGDYCNANVIEQCYFEKHDANGIHNLGDNCVVDSNVFEPLRSGAAGAYLQDATVGTTNITFRSNWTGDGNGTGTWFVVNGLGSGSTGGTVVFLGGKFAPATTGIQLNAATSTFTCVGARFESQTTGIDLNSQTINNQALIYGNQYRTVATPINTAGSSITSSLFDVGTGIQLPKLVGTLTLGANSTNNGALFIFNATGTAILTSEASGDTNPRLQILGSGTANWGPGNAVTDTQLSRLAANSLGVSTADFSVATAGRGLRVKEGSNAKQGTAVLVAGTVTVANTSVTASSRILLTSQADGGTPGWLRVSARTAGTSFTITSSSGTDTSTVAYQIFEPA